ncbi:hypothetical protein GGS24DRAFT_444270 [Hypoxylon argillaceum]|nr:hypothetical protein GGS24DRAFT_444270 [Hypoxylon argillaceum]
MQAPEVSGEPAGVHQAGTSAGSIFYHSLEVITLTLTWTFRTLRFCVSGLWSLYGGSILVGLLLLGGVLRISLLGLITTPSSPTRYEVKFANAVPLAAQDNLKRQTTDFRVMLNDGTPQRAIKYVSISSDVQSLGVRKGKSNPVSIIQIPLLPNGDWNTADIGLTPDGKQIFVATVSCKPLPGVENKWYPHSLEYLDLELVSSEINRDHIKVVSNPKLDTPKHLAVMKFSPFADGIMRIDVEAEIYNHIDGSSVAPMFLGYVTENGRIIGFLIEYIDGARSPSSQDAFSDLALEKCRQTLTALHELGVTHNDARPGNCLFRRDGTAVLIDFELADIATDPDSPELRRGFEWDFERMGIIV